MNSYIEKLKRKQDLTEKEISDAMHKIMSGLAQEDKIAEFLMALNLKGPTVAEITGAAELLQKFYQPVKTKHKVILDTCGTGGDKRHTFNISTVTAFVVAASGVVVAKHGNRSVSSLCGSADVLEAMGVNLNLGQDALGKCLDEIGIAFLFAQKLHPAMKNVAPVRKALAVETIFNILGPLINPAKATHQMMGVYNRDLLNPIAHVLKNLGLKRALVVHGADGLDEVTLTGKTFVAEWDGKEIDSFDIDPEELGMHLVAEHELKGGDLKTNIRIFKEILDGERSARRDIVVLNAACALFTAEKVNTISDGIPLACEAINTGLAKQKLAELIHFTSAAQQ